MIRRLQIETDYEDIFALSQFAFQYQLSVDELNKKREEAWRHIIWGYFDGSQLAAKLHVIPLSVYVLGKEFKMGGVSSVATWPEYRRKGMVRDLIQHALKYMKDHGQLVAYLHPFSVPFYRQYGWEVTFNEKVYSIPMSKLRNNWTLSGFVRRISAEEVEVLDGIYHQYAKKFTGALVRDKKWWNQRVLSNDHIHIAVAYSEQNLPDGYILFEVKDKVLTVIELVYLSVDAWKQLLQFIANHDSMADKIEMVVPENDVLPLLVDEPRFEQKIEPYFMARIVDVNTFLNEYPFEVGLPTQINLDIVDDFLPENSGMFQLEIQESNVTCVKMHSDSPQKVVCSVQQLTSILFGYTSLLELYEIGKIKGDREEVEKLEKAIPRQQPFFADYF